MNEEDLKEAEMRDLFAGIALPGVVGRAGMFYDPADVARDCYNIAEWMIIERRKRIEQDERKSSTDPERVS
jgi:hypothetical protein